MYGLFTSFDIDTSQKESAAYIGSSERHRQRRVNKIHVLAELISNHLPAVSRLETMFLLTTLTARQILFYINSTVFVIVTTRCLCKYLAIYAPICLDIINCEQ